MMMKWLRNLLKAEDYSEIYTPTFITEGDTLILKNYYGLGVEANRERKRIECTVTSLLELQSSGVIRCEISEDSIKTMDSNDLEFATKNGILVKFYGMSGYRFYEYFGNLDHFFAVDPMKLKENSYIPSLILPYPTNIPITPNGEELCRKIAKVIPSSLGVICGYFFMINSLKLYTLCTRLLVLEMTFSKASLSFSDKMALELGKILKERFKEEGICFDTIDIIIVN